MSKKIVIEPVFETFNPKKYLRTYYSKIGSENHSLLSFFTKAFKDIKKSSALLEFGGGPSIYALAAAAPNVKRIHFSDYLEHNLAEVKLWKENKKDAFNWDKFFRRTLYLEGNKRVSKRMTEQRKNMVRRKITKFLHCDAFKKDPINRNHRKYYDIINTNFVVESITNNKRTWKKLVTNVCSMLKDDGILIMTAIKGANYYHVGNKSFPAAKINETDIVELLTKLGFSQTSFLLESVSSEIEDPNMKGYTGYTGLIFVMAKK